jgi:hypothetical protein
LIDLAAKGAAFYLYHAHGKEFAIILGRKGAGWESFDWKRMVLSHKEGSRPK